LQKSNSFFEKNSLFLVRLPLYFCFFLLQYIIFCYKHPESDLMKELVIVYDGMADRKISTLGGRTPMQAAHKPTMDTLAHTAMVGTVSNVPAGMVPESDTANLAILSYDPKVYSKGRSPLEAVSMGLTMQPDETAYRCNVVTLSDEGDYDDKIILDHSAGEISTAEADELIATMERVFGNEDRHFYTGVSYRHCLLWRNSSDTYPFNRPHDILGRRIGDYLPHGEEGKPFYDLMRASYDVLKNHPVNLARRKAGKRVANSIWLWSPGKKPSLPSFRDKWGLDAAVISAVDLIKGIALCAGMESIDVEGATGNLHTNYSGKANAAIDAFKRGKDLVYIHVEAPDECGHQGDAAGKVESIEQIDRLILTPVYEYLRASGEPFRILTLPDHPTPIELRTHSIDPVPFMIYDSNKCYEGVETLDEDTAQAKNNYLPNGTALMELLLRG
jgi:2,3-bisphosphoglycerate-independent phosphoglycerate mutase